MERFRIKYLGGIGRVTGSCTLVTISDTRFLIDCGMVQGEAHESFENNKDFEFDPKKIKFVILTHAHLDHCGLLPRLVQEGFRGLIYCTAATKDLAIEILNDSANLSKLYTEDDINKLNFNCFDERKDFKWGHLLTIDNDLALAFYRSAHILGSVSAVVADKVTKDNVWFSGDVGRNCRSSMSQPLLKYLQSPDYRNKLVICESTNGASGTRKSPMGFEERQKFYTHLFKHTLDDKNGSVVIPAFSIQRTQDILTDLFLLFENKPDLCNGISVICDSPLARRVSKIYAKHLFNYVQNDSEKNYMYLNPALLEQCSENGIETLKRIFMKDKVTIGKHKIEWKKPGFENARPSVYLSSAGMCSAGPVVNHLKRVLPDENNTVVLTGYQSKGTVGSKLFALMNGESIGGQAVFPDGDIKSYEVRAEIKALDCYSGHASTEDLLNYLFNEKRKFCPPEIHLNHGDNNARDALARAISERYGSLNTKHPGKFVMPKVVVPSKNSEFALNNGIINELVPSDSRYEIDHLQTIVDNQEKLLSELISRVTDLESRLVKF